MPKRPKLTSFPRVSSFVPQAAFSEIMDTIDAHGVPEPHSRRSQYRAKKFAASRTTPYGMLVEPFSVPCIDGDVTVAVQNPLAMLHVACSDSTPFALLVRATLASKPLPWSLVVYMDEVTPGDPLKNDQRKTQCVYWSFKESGPLALCNEECWFVVSVVRSTIIQELPGGMSHWTRLLLTEWFFNNERTNLQTAGVIVNLDGEDSGTLLVAHLKCVIADEKALKELIGCKGASGTKLCSLCKNIVSFKSKLDKHDATGYLVSSLCVDTGKFDLHTDRSILNIVHRLRDESVRVGPTPFAELQCNLGGPIASTAYSWVLRCHLEQLHARCTTGCTITS